MNSSDYNIQDCNVNQTGLKCSTNQQQSCVEVINQSTTLLNSCSYEILNIGFFYQYFQGSCIETPQTCDQISQSKCNQLTAINNNLGQWDGFHVLNKISQKILKSIAGITNLSQLKCKQISKTCELDFIYFARCIYSQCLNVLKLQCNYITLNRNIQYTQNSFTCQVRTCNNTNEEFTSIYQCILWLDSCTYDENLNLYQQTLLQLKTTQFLSTKSSYQINQG
ncbi:unnamed protein product [Paramecium sonneborni]|uniref:Uncharacterized protein n=1 Tax=Paramecium sonneborni TaxID=65129 RepID=A0A8S1RXJ9_9CILI|nr:unnamed protein product [Paramecium sonneborni]